MSANSAPNKKRTHLTGCVFSIQTLSYSLAQYVLCLEYSLPDIDNR